MQHFSRLLKVQFSLLMAVYAGHVLADDPLEAMPSATDSIEQKVARISEADLKRIALPDQKKLILSFSKTPAILKEGDVSREKFDWLRVYSSGEIDCLQVLPVSNVRRKGTLSQSELTWLLHILVNECDAFNQTTKNIQDKLEDHLKDRSGKPLFFRPSTFHYTVHLKNQKYDFSIPESAMVIRPIRRRVGLLNFASLHRYANYLVARTYLGNHEEREAIQQLLNEKLKKQHPDLPAFQSEHLAGAVRMENVDLSAVFQQEIDLGMNKYRRVTGYIIRRETGSDPTVRFNILNYSKYRAGPQGTDVKK